MKGRLYKFGKTSYSDVLDRFSEDIHNQHGWRAIPLSKDYDVKVLWSRWVTVQEAAEAEAWFAQTYPKTFFSEVQYNGISECRDWSVDESYGFKRTLDEKFPKDKEYLSEVRTDTHIKIYYVMLTKKQI